jgi:hypothetical protein
MTTPHHTTPSAAAASIGSPPQIRRPSTLRPIRSHTNLNLNLSTIRTIGRKSFSDLRRAFKNPYPTPTLNIEIRTEPPPPHPPIAVPFVPHRNAPPAHHLNLQGDWDSEIASFMSRQCTGSGSPAFRPGTPTRTNSMYSSMSMNASFSISTPASMSTSMSMGEMRMPVDVHRLSGALTIVTLDSKSKAVARGAGGGGKKVNRGARLCETGSGEASPA